GVTEVTIWQLSERPLTKETRGTPAQRKEPPLEAAKAAPQQKKPATPSEEYQALLQEYGNALSEYGKAYGEAKTDAEREKVAQEKLPKSELYAVRALALAQKYSNDPVAVAALPFGVQRILG